MNGICLFKEALVIVFHLSSISPLQAGGPRGATTGVQRIHLMQTLHVVRGD